MQVFVTGGNGFLGRHLVRALRAAGHVVFAPSSQACDLRCDNSLDQWNKVDFAQIWHLAAWTQAGDFCLHHPGEQWIINQEINTRVLKWWVSRQRDAKLITIGTSCAYAPDQQLTEDRYLEGTPIASLYTYAMTKRMLLVGLRALAQQFGLRHLTLVPSTLYGTDYHDDGRQRHFIFDLILKILRGQRYGDRVVLWGDGDQMRELVHVGDFIAAAVELSRSVDNDIVNVGAGEERSIREFAGIICKYVGADPEAICYDRTRYVGARSKCLDIKKLRSLYPGYSSRALAEGLPPVIDWTEATLLRR